MDDQQILSRIEGLTHEEQQLYSKGENLTAEERKRAHRIQVELDRYWDYLRQRRALRDAGKDPNSARLRDSGTVESYLQ